MTTAPFLREIVYSWITNGTMMVLGAVKGAISDNFPPPYSPRPPSSLSTLTNTKASSATSDYKSNNDASHSTGSSPRRPS
jgi:hypothetical protein